MADTSETSQSIQEIKQSQEDFMNFVKEEIVEIHAMLNLIYDNQNLLLITRLGLPKEEHEAANSQALDLYRKVHREKLSKRLGQSKEQRS